MITSLDVYGCMTTVYMVMNYTLNVGLPIPKHPYKIQDAHQSGHFMNVWLTGYTVWIKILASVYLYQGIHARYKMHTSLAALYMDAQLWIILSA